MTEIGEIGLGAGALVFVGVCTYLRYWLKSRSMGGNHAAPLSSSELTQPLAANRVIASILDYIDAYNLEQSRITELIKGLDSQKNSIAGPRHHSPFEEMKAPQASFCALCEDFYEKVEREGSLPEEYQEIYDKLTGLGRYILEGNHRVINEQRLARQLAGEMNV